MKFQKRYIFLIASLIIVGLLFYFLGDIVGYIIAAWVLMLIGLPLKNFLLRKLKLGKLRYGNEVSSVLVLMLFVSILVIILIFFIPLLYNQFQILSALDYSKIGEAFNEPLGRLEDIARKFGVIQDRTSLTEQITAQLKEIFIPKQFFVFFQSIVNIVASFGIAFGSILFIGFFFIKDNNMFSNVIKGIVPSAYETETGNAMSAIAEMLSRYFSGLAIQTFLLWVIQTTALMILGIKNAWLIGFFGATVNLVPYLGPWIGAIFGILVTVTAQLNSGNYTDLWSVIFKVGGVFGISQIIDNFFITPYVFSKRVVAHPLEIFLVVLVGAKIGGLVGMIFAIPSYTILRVLAGTFLSEFRVVQKFTAGINRVIK